MLHLQPQNLSVIMSVATPTREQILSLYRAHLATARSFVCIIHCNADVQASYNFREYFVRRARDQYRAYLYPQMSVAAQNVNASASKLSNVPTANTAIKPVEPMSAEKLAKFYEEACDELKVLQRAVMTNKMYAGERLVVEDEGRKEWIVRSSEELGHETSA